MQTFLFCLIQILNNNGVNYLEVTLLLFNFTLLNVLNNFKLIKIGHLVRKNSIFIIGIENTVIFGA